MKFIELPPELLLRILDRASAPSCVRCRQVCHLLQELVDEEASIQYKIELYAAGMVDSPSCNLPTPARLDAIRAYQDAWSRLKWKGELQLEFDPFTWTTVGDVLAMVDESGDFFFQTIPSTLRGQNPGRQWSFSSGTHTEDFGVDPSQNLIIFLTGVAGTDTTESSVKLHIRLLEDGTPHPAARGDVHLDIPYLEGTAYAILICGPHAITAYTTEEPTPRTTFRIFNWKTGAPIALCPKEGVVIQDLAFINDRYLLCGAQDDDLEESESPMVYLLIWDLQEDRSICKMNFALDVPCDLPQVAITPDYPNYASPAYAFSPSPDTQGFSVVHSDHTIHLFSSTLQNLIQKASTLSVCLEVDWASWGAETTTFCDDTDVDSLDRHVYGEKLATLDAVEAQPTGVMRMFNFNRRAVLRQQCVGPVDRDNDDDDIWIIHTDPSDLPDLFKTVSSSRLPFSQLQKKLRTKADINDVAGLVINTDAIIIPVMSGFEIFYF